MPILAIDELRHRLRKLFTSHGLAATDARALVDIILWAEASGRRTHGLIRVRPMLERLDAGGHRPGRWLKEAPGSALYDGCGGLGYLVAYECTRKAIELTTRGGSSLAVVGTRGATHTGPIGYFARICALEGLISICLTDCSPIAAPFGASSPVLGTNPVTMGFPSAPEPVVVDMATTTTTYGDCQVAISEGRQLPRGVALDRSGEPTTDPWEAIHRGSLLPFGGHKGYALALAVQILTSAFTGAAAVPEPGEDYGYTVIVMRRDILVSGETFDRLLKELLFEVKQARPADPASPVLIPGERSAARRAEAEEKGIDLPKSLYDEIFEE